MDIETEELADFIRAVGLSMSKMEITKKEKSDEQEKQKCVLLASCSRNGTGWPDPEIIVLENENRLFRALGEKIKVMDPDTVTGRNIIDFGFPRLDAAFTCHHSILFWGRKIGADFFSF